MITPEQLCAITQELLEHLGLAFDCEASQDGDMFLLNLNGKDARYLEGSKDNRVGALLVVIKLIAKHRHGVEPKVVLDFNHQRQQRLSNVAQMARKTAEMVRLRGGEEELRPMTPAERRAVHMELKQMDGIRTESRGEEPHRRIVIIQSESEE